MRRERDSERERGGGRGERKKLVFYINFVCRVKLISGKNRMDMKI